MKPDPLQDRTRIVYRTPWTEIVIQAPLPHFLHTLPILLTIQGQGSGRQGPSPSAPAEPSPNE